MIQSEINTILATLKDFSPDSKVWVYYSEKDFSEHSLEIQSQLNQFTQNWKSHGSPVKGSGHVISGHILLLVADTSVCEVSGCSTDSSVQFITQLGQQFQLHLFDRQVILLNIDDKIVATKLDQLGQYSSDTLVFNPFFSDLENWRESFVQKLQESKYKRFAAAVK
jgi:hypothetical protein